jgi:hypothetical protein
MVGSARGLRPLPDRGSVNDCNHAVPVTGSRDRQGAVSRPELQDSQID